jgi:hypothetical protein
VSLSYDHDARVLNRLRWLSNVLDDAYRVPGTNLRFGWDPIIGMIPWLGDVLTGFFSLVILLHAHRLRVPTVIKLRMLINVVIDVLIGIVPFLGDAFDIAWKANRKNMQLLDRHALTQTRAGIGDWLFVLGALLVFTAVAILPLFAVWWLARSLSSHLGIQPPGWRLF